MSINETNGTDTQGRSDDLTPDAPPRSVESEGRENAGAGGSDKPRRPRGFAAMDRGLVTEIARKGGKAAHTAGTAHEFTTDEAREAGRKGGRATHAKRRKVAETQPRSARPEEKHEG
jgi:general stress protein YciG